MNNWGQKLLTAAALLGIGYKSPTLWLSISVVFWVAYAASYLTSPLLIAATQNSRYAKIAKQTLAVLGTLASAALISAPVVMVLWYRAT